MNSRWMKSAVLVLCLLLSVPALALAQSGSGNGGNGNGGNGTVNGRTGSATFQSNNPMPVMIWTVWGLDSSGSGTVSTSSDVSTVVLYDNGLATWSQSNADGSNTSGCTGPCIDTAQLSTSQINDLLQQLRRSGAFRQNSNNSSASPSDTSLTTITVFSFVKGSTSVANTFSFHSAQGRLGTVQNAFSQFLSDNFGSSTINGGSGTGTGSGQ